jgi:hypothetical protein
MILLILLAFLGLIAGVILANYTKEELDEGKKYFILLEKLVLLLIIVLLLFKTGSNFFVTSIFFILGAVSFSLIGRTYPILALAVLMASFFSNNYFGIVVALVFLYGLPIGTLLFKKFIKNKKRLFRELLTDAILFALPFSLVLVSNILIFYNSAILSFISGALFLKFIKK